MNINEKKAREFLKQVFDDTEDWKLKKVESTLNHLDQFSDDFEREPEGDTLSTFNLISSALEEGQEITVTEENEDKKVSKIKEKEDKPKKVAANKVVKEKPEKTKDKSEKPKKSDPDNKSEEKSDKRDFLNCQVGKPPARINACLTEEPQSAEEIAKKCKQEVSDVKKHLNYWFRRETVVQRNEEGKYFRNDL